MSDDKIAEIRERHTMYPPSRNARYSFILAYQDIATLLAEVERLREALKIVRINGPDSNGLVWVSFCREGGVRVSFVMGHEEEMVSQALLEFEQIRRNALEAKP